MCKNCKCKIFAHFTNNLIFSSAVKYFFYIQVKTPYWQQIVVDHLVHENISCEDGFQDQFEIDD